MKTVTDLSVDARVLAQMLQEVEPGGLLRYTALSKKIGRDVQGKGRGALCTARRFVLREHRIAFGCVRGEGLQRLDDAGKVATFDDVMGRIRRKAKRAARVIAAVEDFDSLPPEQQVRHNTAMSVLGVVATVTDTKQVKRLEAKVAQENAMLAARDSLALFARDDG